MQQKAYNLRSTLTVLKAFSGMRNAKSFALLVVKCKFGGTFFCPKKCLAPLGRLEDLPTLICSFNSIMFFTQISSISSSKQTTCPAAQLWPLSTRGIQMRVSLGCTEISTQNLDQLFIIKTDILFVGIPPL